LKIFLILHFLRAATEAARVKMRLHNPAEKNPPPNAALEAVIGDFSIPAVNKRFGNLDQAPEVLKATFNRN